MPNYKLCRDLRYNILDNPNEDLIIKKGSIVYGVHKSQMTLQDQIMARRVEKRVQSKNIRYAFFKAHGVVRYAVLIKDLVPTRKVPNVPTI